MTDQALHSTGWSLRLLHPHPGPSSRKLSLPVIPMRSLLAESFLSFEAAFESHPPPEDFPPACPRFWWDGQGLLFSLSSYSSLGRSPHLIGNPNSNRFCLDSTALLTKHFGFSYLI